MAPHPPLPSEIVDPPNTGAEKLLSPLAIADARLPEHRVGRDCIGQWLVRDSKAVGPLGRPAGPVIVDPMRSTRRVATGTDTPAAQRQAGTVAARVIVLDDAVQARARESRRRQGLPATLEDPVVVGRIATLVANRGPVRDTATDTVHARRHLQSVQNRVEHAATPPEPTLFALEDQIVA